MSSFFGFHRTINPLDLQWRWKYWNKQQKRKKKANFSEKQD